MRLHGGSHAVLQQLQQHVADVAGHVGEVQVCAPVDAHLGGVAMRAATHIGRVCNHLLGDLAGRGSLGDQADHVGV